MEVKNKQEGNLKEEDKEDDLVDDFDDHLEFSQDVFAQSCAIVHPFN